MENETGLNFIGTPKVNENIDIEVSYYNITIDECPSSSIPDNIRITKDHILSTSVGSSANNRNINGKTNSSGSFSSVYENSNFEYNSTWDQYHNTIEDCIISFDESIVLFKGDFYENTYYIWALSTALAEDYNQYDYIGTVTVQIGIAVSSAYVFSLDTYRITIRYTTSNSVAYASYDGYIAGYDGIEKICCSPYGKFVCLYSISDYANYQDIIFTINDAWEQIMTFNGMTLGNHYSVTSQEIRTEKAFSPDETLLIESLPDLGIVKVWEWDNTNSIWNQKGQTLMEQDYSQTYSSLIGDSYKNLNLGSGTGFGRALEINISSDRIKIEDNNDNLYIFDMNELAPDTWNLQYTTNMVTEWENFSINTQSGAKEITLYGSNFFQNSIVIVPLEYAEIEYASRSLPYIDLDIQLGIIPETINVYRSLYYYNEVDSSGNLIGDFTETSNDNTIISWNTDSIHSWTDTNDSNSKSYTIQSEDWKYKLKVEAEYAGQTYIGYVNGINNKGMELPLSGYSMTDNTITSTSEDINVKIIFVSLEGDYYKIDFEDNIFDYNLVSFYDSNETDYSLIQINNRDMYVPDSFNVNDGIISSDNTIQKQFQWFRNGVAITTIQDYDDTIDTGYTITADDTGQTITVKLTYLEQEFENNGIDFSDTFFVDSNIGNIECDLRINTEIYLTGLENTISFLSDPIISVDSNIAMTGELQISKDTTYLDRISYTFQPRAASEGIYNQLGRIYYYNIDLYNSRSSNLSTLPTNENEINDTYNPDGTLSGTVINSASDPMNAIISGDGQTFAIAFKNSTYDYVICYNASDMEPFCWIESPQQINSTHFGDYMAFSYDGEYLFITGYGFRIYNSSIGSDMQLSQALTTNTGGAFLYRRNYTTNRYELYKYNFYDDVVDNIYSLFGYSATSYRIWSGDMSDDAQYILLGGVYLAVYFQWNDNTNEYEIVKYFDYQDFYGTLSNHNVQNTRYVTMNSDGTVVVIKGPGDERNYPMTVYEWTGNSTSNIGSNPKRDDFVQIFQELDSTVQTSTGYPIFKGNFIVINGSGHDYTVIYEYIPRNGDTQGSVVQRGSKIITSNFPEITTSYFALKNKSFDITNDGMILCVADYSRILYFFRYSIDLQDWEFQFTIYEEPAANMEVVRIFEDGKIIVGGNAGNYSVQFDHYTHYFTVDYGTNAEFASSGGNIKYTPSITNGVDTSRFIFSDSITNLTIQKDFNISVFTSTAPIADTNDIQLETRMTVGKTPPSLIINPNDYFTDADLSDEFQNESLSFSIAIGKFNKINVRRISSASTGADWILYSELQVWINNENIIQTVGATASYKSGDSGYSSTPASNAINNDISDRAITDNSNTIDNDYCILVTLNQSYDISQLQSIVLYQSDSRIEGCVIELFDDEELTYTSDALPLHPTNASNYTDGANHSIRIDGPVDFSSITTTDVTEFATKIINNSTSTLVLESNFINNTTSNITMDSNTFEITYIPNTDLTEDTSVQLTIIATDKYGLTDEKIININININSTPTFANESTTLNMYKEENLSETFTIHCLTLFTDPGDDSPIFSVDSSVGLQYGSIIIDNDRILYTVDSNINEETTDTIQITATDTLNESVTQLFDIVIGIALDNTTNSLNVPKYPRINPDTDTNLYDFSVKHTPGVETHLVIDARNYFYEQNDNDYSLTFSGTGTYGKIDRSPSSEPTFTKNRITGSFSSFLPSYSGVAFKPYADQSYPLVTSLTFNEENNFRQGPFYIKPQARLYNLADNLNVALNIVNFPFGISSAYSSYQRIWIVQKSDGTHTFMSQFQHTEYYLTSDLNMSTSDIENSLSLTIESNLNGSFSFVPSTSPTQYLVSNDNNISFDIGDATDENHANSRELFQQNYMLYDSEVNNKVRYIVNDDVTGNVQDQVTLIATNEWNLTSEVTININIETVSSPLPSTFDIIQYMGETSEIVTIENISDYFLDSSGTISSFYYTTNNFEGTDDITITDNILTHTINSTYMIKNVIVEVVPFMIYGGSDDFTDNNYQSYRIEKKFDINVEVSDVIATVYSDDVTISLNKAQGYERTLKIINISQYFTPLNLSDIMTFTATSQFGEITIDGLNLTCAYNENITEDTIDEIVIQMTNQDNYFARKTINIDIKFYIPDILQLEGGTSEISLSTLFSDLVIDIETSFIIDSNFGLQYGNVVVDEEDLKIIYTADSNLNGFLSDDTFKVQIETPTLIAHYEFNDSTNVGKCSVDSANDLILFGGANIVTDTLSDSPLLFQNGVNFTGNTNGDALITNNINFGNSTHTISFWANQPSRDQCIFFAQGHHTSSLIFYGSSGSGKLYLKTNTITLYPATNDTNITTTGASTTDASALVGSWHMHTVVIRDDGVIKLYIDGQFYSSTETANRTFEVFTNELNGYLTIGGLLETGSSIYNPTEGDLSANTNNDYEGYMQDFRIYNGELSETQIDDLYNSTPLVLFLQEKIVMINIITDEPPVADTNETIFTIGQTIGEESVTTTVDITPYFTDNGPLTYSVDTNYGTITGSYIFENNNIIYTTDSNMTEDVVDQINIIAQDEVGQTVEKVITFNVTANNKPEADTNVLSYSIYDLTIPVIVDVTDVFSDIDLGDELTTIIDTSYGLTNGTAVIENNNLSYLASVDIKDNRTDEVKLIVTDSFNATAEKILNINISPIIVQSDINIVVYKNIPKVLNLEDYITSGTLLSSTVDETYGLANGFIRKDSNTVSFSEYNPRLNVIESDIFKIILNNTIELIVNIQMESGIIEANFVEGDTNLIIEATPGEDPKVDLSQFVSNPAEKPLEIEISQDVLEQINGEINIDSNTNEITYVPDNNVSGPQTIIFEVKIFD